MLVLAHPPPARWPARAVGGVGALGVAWAGVATAMAYGQTTLPLAPFILGELVGVAFLGAGLLARIREPESRVGPLMVACGASWYLPSLEASGNPVAYALGYWLYFLPLLLFTHLALAFPQGRLTSRVDRWTVGFGYVAYLVPQGIRYLLEGAAGPMGWVWPDHPPESRLGDLLSVIGLGMTVVATTRIVHRWRAAVGPARRAYGPAWAGIVLTELIGLVAMGCALLRAAPVVQEVLAPGFGVGLLALPFAFSAGLVRMRLTRLRIADLVREIQHPLPPPRMQELLGTALNDPTLALGFWPAEGDGYGSSAHSDSDSDCDSDSDSDRDGYVDVHGRPVALPTTDPDRVVLPIDHDGRPLAVLVHDRAANLDRTMVAAVVAAARIALETARLHAVERANLARLLEVTVEERRRIGRDLHDGIQHRLLVLEGLARQAHAIAIAGPELAGVLDRLADEAGTAYRELRALAQGIHPQILTECGLAVAVEERAATVPVPVLIDLPGRRWPPGIEATAYFAICEALTNTTKYAGATKVTVRSWERDDHLVVEIADDGRGGADPRRGSGLRGLRDRVHALGGTVTLTSPAGAGTTVTLELPCA